MRKDLQFLKDTRRINNKFVSTGDLVKTTRLFQKTTILNSKTFGNNNSYNVYSALGRAYLWINLKKSF